MARTRRKAREALVQAADPHSPEIAALQKQGAETYPTHWDKANENVANVLRHCGFIPRNYPYLVALLAQELCVWRWAGRLVGEQLGKGELLAAPRSIDYASTQRGEDHGDR